MAYLKRCKAQSQWGGCSNNAREGYDRCDSCLVSALEEKLRVACEIIMDSHFKGEERYHWAEETLAKIKSDDMTSKAP